jgi:Tol biopolymer transport system component
MLMAGADAATATASDRYDPRLRFRTLSTPGFDIHFHQGEDAPAKRLAAIAEAVARELEPTLGRPRQRVHVILVDQDDRSNGWATPVPSNVIEITAAAPGGADLIGNTSDWLRLVFVHEYTHILHLDRSRGVFGGLRRVFGRHPLLMPNLFVPPWQIEGLATYYESVSTGEGRLPAGDFGLMLHRAAAARRFASLDRASNPRVDWPSGNAPYLYGGYFHDYLADVYGQASLAQLADVTAGRIPYLGSGGVKSVFGKSLGSLWDEFESYSRGRAERLRPGSPPDAGGPGRPSPATRLTTHGFIVSAPAYSPDGRLFYSVSNPHGFPALMELAPGGGSREVTSRVGGGRVAATRHEIVFDQVEYVRSVGVQSDLYAVRLDSGAVRRLTREARAGDPDLSPDGRTIVCTVQSADRRFLATLPAGTSGSPAALVSEPDTHYASPRWSPDGQTIVAERRRLGGTSEIVLIAAAGGPARVLSTSATGRNVWPSWTPDGQSVLFASDRDGRFQLYRADVATQRLNRLVNGAEGASAPALSPEGETLVFVGYTADGFDLFSIPWAEAEWLEASEGSRTTTSNFQLPTHKDPKMHRPGTPRALAVGSWELSRSRRYNPWPTLLPRFWTPIVEPDGDDTAVGAATAGADALGRHAYAVGAAWTTRRRPNWYATYLYDRWRPTLFVSISDETDPWRSGTIRSRELDAGAALAFRTFRRTQSLSAALHVSADRFACGACEPAIDERIDRRALRGGWSFSSARDYGYSVSLEEGVRASVSGEWSPRALGSTGDSRSVVVDVRGYAPAAPRHGVIALRGAAAASWGDAGAARVFGAGGSGPAPAGGAFDRDAIALVRGFDTDDISGPRALALNADYRFPLAWIERGLGTWPVFLRSLHGAVFADGGAAWSRRLTTRRTRSSVGVELSADLVIGHGLPLTVVSGVAWRHDTSGAARGAAFFARAGRAF